MTLNQIVSRLQAIAESHKQIKTFRCGDPVLFLKGDLEYPACMVNILPGSISRAQKQTNFRFEIFLCDLVNLAEDSKVNELEVQSDLTSIAEDFMSLLYSSAYQSEWTVGDEASLEYQYEALADYVTAAVLTVSISSRNDANRCQVPINS